MYLSTMKHKILLIIITAIYNCMDFVLNNPIGIGPIHSPRTFIDDYIPLVPLFVVPYLSYDPFLYLSLYLFAKQKKSRIFYTSLIGVWITFTITFLTFYFYQTSVLRPEILTDDIFSQVLQWVYRIDNHYAALPSLHVGLAVLSMWGWFYSKASYKWLMIFWGLLICISTVFVKQHYFIDVVSGALLATLSYAVGRKFVTIRPYA